MNKKNKKICRKCLKENKSCLITIGACPLHDYKEEDLSTALYAEIKKQNGE